MYWIFFVLRFHLLSVSINPVILGFYSESLLYLWVEMYSLYCPLIELGYHNLQKTWNARRRKTKVWILHSFLEWGTKYPWKELQGQSLELRQKEGPSSLAFNCIMFDFKGFYLNCLTWVSWIGKVKKKTIKGFG